MTRATVRNGHNGPVDVDTLDGSKRVPAMGQLTANFADDYLGLLEASGVMTVERSADEKPKARADEKKKGR